MVGSPAKEIDAEMREASKTTEGLAKSRHAVKQLSEKEMERMVKEIGLKEEIRIEEEDKEIEEDKKDDRSDLFNALRDSRNAVSLIKAF